MRQLVVAIALLASGSALALDPRKAITQYRHQVWRAEEGLPQAAIIGLAQTPDGYLWLGTYEGLLRFDGVRFTLLDKRNSPELGDNFIETVRTTRDGSLLVGTRYGALHRLAHGKLERLATLDGPIAWTAQTPDDCVWIGVYDRGAFRMCGGKLTRIGVTEGLPSDKVSDVWADPDGTVWLATRAGLARRATDGKVRVYTTRDGLPSDHVVGMARIKSTGSLWVVTGDGGAWVLQGERFLPYGARQGFTDDPVTVGIEDRDGNAWLGTSSAGLFRVPGARTLPLGRADRMQLGTAFALIEDREGSLWMAERGVGLHRFSEGRFTPWGVPEGLPADSVVTLAEGKDGAMWMGTIGGGLARMARDGSITSFGRKEGLTSETVTAVHEGGDGRLLVGLNYLPMLERKAGRFVPAALPGGAEIRSVCILAPAPDGSLWIGSRGYGAYRVSGGTLQAFTQPELPSDYVLALRTTSDGSTYIATNGGLARMRQGRLERLGAAHGLTTDHPSALHIDARGALWVGTTDAGLFRLDGERFVSLGGCGDAVDGIVEDELGYLWLAGHRGVWRFPRREADRQVPACAHFGVADGMRSAEVASELQPVALRASDGRIWFATMRGAAVVDPWAATRINRLPAPVHIEELRADRREIPRERAVLAAGTRDLEIRYTATSLVAPEQVRFKYRLEGFDRDWVDAGTRRVAYYTNLPPGSYRFSVTATNNDGLWNQEGASLPLSLLPHFWQTRVFWIASGAAGLLAVYALFRLRLRSLERQKRELERQVEARTAELKRAQAELVQSEKMSALGQLTAGVAHELNNPVNFITSNIGALEERYRQLVALAGELEQLIGDDDARRRAAARMRDIDFDFIREDGPDLLRAFRNGADRITAIVDRLRMFTRAGEQGYKPADLIDGLRATIRLLEPMFRDQVRVRVETEALPEVVCNAALMNQVFMNILINAAQAMNGVGEIVVSAAREGERVRISFRDHGPGVPAELRPRIFEPFFTTKEVGQGAGLGLSISFDVVSEHGGTLTVGDAEGGGAVFEVRVPIAGPQRPVAQGAQGAA